jgi:phosphatidylinositol alpha-mannosyltransferase
MRVAIFTPYDLSRDGGVNRHVRSLGGALEALGHAVRIAGPASGEVPDGCHGFRGVVPVPANGSIARVGLLVPPGPVAGFLRGGDFDLVHVHEPIVPGPGRHAIRLARAPVVATFHANAEHELPLQRLLRFFASAFLGRIERGIAVSHQAKRFSRTIYRGRTAVIPNGVDLSRFHPAARRPSPELPGVRPLQILFVGRFGEQRKGFGVLIDAVARLRESGRPAELVVVGEGPRERFAARAAGLLVRFEGRLPDEALAARFASADVFCAPSLGGESFGMVLVEAMAAGCPVVASDIPGYAEAARGAALLSPAGDAGQLADALWRVGRDAPLRARLTERGRARAETLSWSHVAAHVARIYVAAGAPPGTPRAAREARAG